jgi:Na+-transporting NADH:ubiquinone oxidoreductase subunit C
MSTRQRIYIKTGSDGANVERFVLPIHGKGLWGPMYGFLALDADGKTIEHLSYYEHQETPGLGAEVDGPVFKRAWPGLIAYDDEGEPQIDVTKGEIPADNESHVASISGATITSNGVEAMVNFWLSDRGYGVFLKKNRTAEPTATASRQPGDDRALAAAPADRSAASY